MGGSTRGGDSDYDPSRRCTRQMRWLVICDSRFTSDIESAATLHTDSNGREMLKRVRDYRPTWNLTVTQEKAGNYYPVNAAIQIADERAALESAIGKILEDITGKGGEVEKVSGKDSAWIPFGVWKKQLINLVRSSGIGTLIGNSEGPIGIARLYEYPVIPRAGHPPVAL